MRRLLAALVMLVAVALPVSSVRAQNRLCFSVPNITNCIQDRFLEFWQQNGGLAVFGYPISDAVPEFNRDTQQTYLTQHFERTRFELHPENARPYDVLLGRLGSDLLFQNGFDPVMAPIADPSEAHYFPETRQAISHASFWSYWSTHGLEFDGQRGTSMQESLALFGLPLTVPRMETNSSGDSVLTQWFERARFEDHGAQGTLLGLVGNEVAPSCEVAPGSIFRQLWGQQREIRDRVGCPTQVSLVAPAVDQGFERGVMYWWGPTHQIYALAGNEGGGRWSQYEDTYQEGEQLAPLSPPSGLIAPGRGFGKVWRNNPSVQQSLGWAVGPEVNFTGTFQRFQAATMLASYRSDGYPEQIYVLFDDGTMLSSSNFFHPK
jgi:hypothetical protein